jgi:hypothetical protein
VAEGRKAKEFILSRLQQVGSYEVRIDDALAYLGAAFREPIDN